jgi:large subunit ribosomal protein L17
MRHKNSHRQLSRNTNQRKALLKGLAISLFEHKRITTTVAKAKELRRFAERLITTAKRQDSFAHRLIFAKLQNKDITKKLITVYGPLYAERPGGYTRILKTGRRLGDQAEMCLIELVDAHGAAESEEASKD